MLSIYYILIILQVLHCSRAPLPDYVQAGMEPVGPELPDISCYLCHTERDKNRENPEKNCDQGPPPLECLSKQASIAFDNEKRAWKWEKNLCRTELAFFPVNKRWMVSRDLCVEEEVTENEFKLDPSKNSTCFKIKRVDTEKDELAPITLVCFCDPDGCNGVSVEKLKLVYKETKTIIYNQYYPGVIGYGVTG